MARALRRLAVVPLVCCIVAIAPLARAADPGLALRVRASLAVAHVGDTIRYSLTVENTGPATIRTVTVRDFVDDDLDVLGVPILDRVASAGLSTILDREEIFWTITRLRPAEKVTVTYKAIVVQHGNGRLDNRATASGSDGSELEVSTSTYIVSKRCFFNRRAA